MDSARVPNADQSIVERRLVRAVKSVRAINAMRGVPIILAIENLPGPIGAVTVYQLDQYRQRTGDDLGQILVLHEYGPDRKPGVPKTAESTRLMLDISRAQMLNDRVHISEQLRVGEGQTPEGNVAKLIEQMRGYQCHVKFNKNDPHSEPRFKWAGIEDDDLLISVMMCIYWEDKFWASEDSHYRIWRNRVGAWAKM